MVLSTDLRIMNTNVGRFLEERQKAFPELLGNRIPMPDVLFVQDIPHRDMHRFDAFPFSRFVPMTNHLINGERAIVGIAIFSRFPFSNVAVDTYWGDGTLKDLEGVNAHNERYLGEESDRLVEKTEDRVLICATVCKSGNNFDVATTHGMWTRGGVTNNIQRYAMNTLSTLLLQEANIREGLVLMGDLNFARGGEIYNLYTEFLTDNVPENVLTTLDPDHPVSKRGINVVSDYVMAAKNSPYSVSDFCTYNGVSDHLVIAATISRKT